MKKIGFCLVISCFYWMGLSGQVFWDYELKAPMPEPVANNAVSSAAANGEEYVYSFAGIDTTRIYSGIHLKAWRYRVSTDQWEAIAPLPDTLGKVAAGASTVKNKIYIIGGYHVYANGNEASSDRVHVYNPETNQYEADAAPIPVPIDDHVQAVWRDSLIFVVTGWSNTTNVPNVQIFDPAQNTWTVGTPVPDNTSYKVFGPAGVIIGDTIFYAGGARFGQNFPLGDYFRIGIIDPNDPSNISWSEFRHPLALGYRQGAFAHKGNVIFAGGSVISYNYNGIAYNGSGPVPPQSRLLNYSAAAQSIFALPDTIPPTMDLRGVAKVNANTFMIVGGMEAGPTVSNQSLMLRSLNPSTDIEELASFPVRIEQEGKMIRLAQAGQSFQVRLLDLKGAVIVPQSSKGTQWEYDHNSLPGGNYLLEVQIEGQLYRKKVQL